MQRLYCAISPASFMWIRDTLAWLKVHRITSTPSIKTVPGQRFRKLMKEQRDCGYLHQHSGISGTLQLILTSPVKCFCQMHKIPKALTVVCVFWFPAVWWPKVWSLKGKCSLHTRQEAIGNHRWQKHLKMHAVTALRLSQLNSLFHNGASLNLSDEYCPLAVGSW